MIKLRIQIPGAEDQVLELGNEALVGRHEDCPVRVPLKTISNQHAKILAGIVIFDLDSLNGIWLAGKKLDGPTLLRVGDTVALGNDVRQSAQIEVLAASIGPSGKVGLDGSFDEERRRLVRTIEELTRENERLALKAQELEERAQRAENPSEPALDPNATMASLPSAVEVPAYEPPTRELHEMQGRGEVASPAPAPGAPPANSSPANSPPANSSPGDQAAAAAGALPSFEDFFKIHTDPVDDLPQKQVPSAPPIPATRPNQGAGPDRQRVLVMIDRIVREDVDGKDPLLEGPVEQFFTLEFFRLLRQVEKVVTRLARDFVQLYEMKTMLPGSAGNLRSMAADCLTSPEDRHARKQLVQYLEELCRWLGVSLVANRKAAMQFALGVRKDLSIDALTGSNPIPTWKKLPFQEEAELWRRTRRYLLDLNERVCEDRLEKYVKDYANEEMERRRV